jgi:GAF domain-containing protein
MSTLSPDEALADVFVLLADSMRPGYDIVDTLDLLVEASTTFTSAVEAGILLVGADGRLHVAASSTECASDVEESQLGVGGGPCSDAIRTGQGIDVPLIPAEQARWPEFVAIAQAKGFNAAHAIPMRLRSQTLGGLNLFSTQPGSLSDRDQALAETFAQLATISILQHQTLTDHGIVNAQLQRALDSRVIIEQAKGVLAQQYGLEMDAAFALLRNHSRRTSSGLRHTARQIVSHGLDIGEDPPASFEPAGR